MRLVRGSPAGTPTVLKTTSYRYFSCYKTTNMPLTVDRLNSRVVDAKYAVRGKLALRAEELRDQLAAKPGSLPFDEVINANIGNPQQLDQKPITFYRQVLALLQYPDMLQDTEAVSRVFHRDAVQRATTLLKEIGSVGAYSHSKGVPYIRKSIAKFIEERDGYSADPEHIYLTTGASGAVSNLISTLGQHQHSGFLIPIPQYPLYSATLTLCDATAVNYYLDESRSWETNTTQLKELIGESKNQGIDLRAIVVINPGNPTGAVLTEQNIRDIIRIAAEDHLVIIADEVYQANVYIGEFLSFKKVLRKMQEEHPGEYDHVELASLHSTSKGMIGECGQRGGYMELVGFSDEVQEHIYKLCSISLCPVVTGQALMELMVNPPKPGDESYEQFNAEVSHIFNSLKERAQRLYNAFKGMKGVSCEAPQGAMYLFPTITIPQKAIDEAAKQGYESADAFYCMELLNATGICVIPGSGFGQEPGTFHLRTTFLAPGADYADRFIKFHEEFMAKYE